jgi:predicted O-methyltransferase YrrM
MLADKVNASIVVEIGSWVGESTCLWADTIKHQPKPRVIAVDWFKGNPGTALDGIAHNENIYAIFKNNITELGFEKIVNTFYMTSKDASTYIDDKYADIVYIDACHDYASVKQDIDLWLPKVKDGGIICGHDCESLTWDERYINQDVVDGIHHGVVKAVVETFQAFNITERIWWTQVIR